MARKRSGYSQKQVEAILGLRNLQIFDYESMRLKLPVEVAVDMANLYGCSLEELLGVASAGNEKPDTLNMVYPLINAGIMKQEYLAKMHSIKRLPYI